MTNNKINIRVELARNTKTGKLALTAIFNENAPNFSKDKEGYYWIPTVDEKDFLNEAFQLMPRGQTVQTFNKKMSPKQLEPELEDTEKTDLEIEEEQVEKAESPKNFEKIEDMITSKPQEKNKTAVFEKAEEDEEGEETENETEEKEEEDDEGLIVSADEEAIDAALNKRRGEKDNSMREADEQTIIDRVLSQKKKGKWSRK